MTRTLRVAVVLAALLGATRAAAAQTGPDNRPDPVLEGAVGYAAFLDDSVIKHSLVGVSARYYLWPRLSVGPELVYMMGPGDDTDLFLTGNLTLDVLAPRGGRPRRVTPFVVAGGGWFRHSDRFGAQSFTASEGAFTGGVGVRGWVSDRVYVSVDARLGWEPHVRLAAGVGARLGK